MNKYRRKNSNYQYSLFFKIKKYTVYCCEILEIVNALFCFYLTRKYVFLAWFAIGILIFILSFKFKFLNGNNDRVILYIGSYIVSLVFLIDSLSESIVIYTLIFEALVLIIPLLIIMCRHKKNKRKTGSK